MRRALLAALWLAAPAPCLAQFVKAPRPRQSGDVVGTHTAEPAFWIAPLGQAPAHLASVTP